MPADGDDESDWHGRSPAIDNEDDVIGVLARRAPEPLTAGDVAEALDVSKRTALRRLQELAGVETADDQQLVERDDRVKTKTVGARSRVFWYDESDT